MAKTEEEKREARNASNRLRYWASRRLKDIIRRKSQVQSWVETYDSILEDKNAKASKTENRRRARAESAAPEARAA